MKHADTPGRRKPGRALVWWGLGLSVLSLVLMWVVHPLAAVALPLAVAVTCAYLFWEVTGTLLFSVVLFLRPSEIIHPGFSALKLGKVTAGACLAAWMFHFFFLGKRQWSRDILSLLVLGLTGSILLSTVTSTDVARSQAFVTDVWIKLALLFYAIVHLTCRPLAFRVYTNVLLGLASILALLGIHKALTALPSELIEGNRVGVGRFLADPNDFAQMLALMGLSYALTFFFLVPQRRKKILYIVLLCVLMSGIGVTRSRGGFLGAAGTGLAVAAPYLSTGAVVAGAAVIGAGGLVYLVRSGRFRSDGIDDSAQGRLDAWLAALHMFRARPVLGVGFECYVVNYLHYVNDPVDWKPKAVHSAWFKVIAELGLLGSLFFFPMILIALKRAYALGRWARKRLTAPEDWWRQALFVPLFPGLFGWCISGSFLSNSFHWFLYIQIALIISATMIKEQMESEFALVGVAEEAVLEEPRAERVVS